MNNLLNNQEPLGLPPGSVRASLAIMVLLTICLMNIREMEVKQEFYMILGTIIGFYFGSRKGIS